MIFICDIYQTHVGLTYTNRINKLCYLIDLMEPVNFETKTRQGQYEKKYRANLTNDHRYTNLI